MQQDNSEMETSHEKKYISNNNYNNYSGLHHRREPLPYRGFALGLFNNLIPRSDKSLGNVCTEELSVDEFSNLVFDTTISNINVKTGDSYMVSYKCNKRLVPKIRSTAIPSQYPRAKEPTTEETPQVKSLLPFLMAQH